MVRSMNQIERYIGLSTDEKPIPSFVATFYESDTKKTYIYDGDTWKEMSEISISGVTIDVGGQSAGDPLYVQVVQQANLRQNGSDVTDVNPLCVVNLGAMDKTQDSIAAYINGVENTPGAPVYVQVTQQGNIRQDGADVTPTNPLNSVNLGALDKDDDSISSFNKLGLLKKSVSFNRPADGNAYAVGDNINDSTSSPTALALTSVVSANGKAIRISKVVLKTTNTSIGAVNVWISTTALTGGNDNALFDISDGNSANIAAVIPLTEKFDSNSNSMLIASGLAEDVICGASSTGLWIMLEAAAAFTPASGETITVEIYYSQLD